MYLYNRINKLGDRLTVSQMLTELFVNNALQNYVKQPALPQELSETARSDEFRSQLLYDSVLPN